MDCTTLCMDCTTLCMDCTLVVNKLTIPCQRNIGVINKCSTKVVLKGIAD